jgi:hypothetical protein
MDPVSAIVTALAIGAGAVIKTIASEPTKDAYQALKSYISQHYKGTAIAILEEKPTSTARQLVVQEALEDCHLTSDPKAAQLANALIESALQRDTEALKVIGVDLNDIKAANIRLKDIVSSGSGVVIKGAAATGDLEIEGVRAGTSGGSDPKN